MTTNPLEIQSIEFAGIRVDPVEKHILPDNGIIASDLASKARKLGHHIDREYR